MKPDSMLECALRLVPVGPGRPDHAMLRRSISTAYYALFAALRQEAARPYSGEAQIAAWRLPSHGAARDVCAVLARSRHFPWMEGKPLCSHDLIDFAENFLALQAGRHSADYDFSYAPSKPDTEVLLVRASDGIRSLESARKTAPDQVQVMCLAMLANPSVRKHMRRS